MVGEQEKSILLKIDSPSTPKLDNRQSRDGRRSLLRLSEKEQPNRKQVFFGTMFYNDTDIK